MDGKEAVMGYRPRKREISQRALDAIALKCAKGALNKITLRRVSRAFRKKLEWYVVQRGDVIELTYTVTVRYSSLTDEVKTK